MFKNYLVKLKESFMAVFPITLIIFALIFFLVPTEVNEKVKLGISAVLLIIGMSLFTLGADSSMQELGENVGSSLSKSKKIWFMVLCSFIIGFIITFAEPDLKVLANQVMGEGASSFFFIGVVSLGVGIFLMFAVMKIIFRIRLSVILTIAYGLILILAFFVPKEFMPIAFDSGSVTTGPISVPFLMSFGLGIAAVRSGKNEDDSFGLIACCSAGPILAVMFMSLFLDPSSISAGSEVGSGLTGNIFVDMGNVILHNLGNVALVLLPILILFFVFQIFSFKFPKRRVIKMCMGFLYTYIGIVLFLTGVECGYLHIGTAIGEYIGVLDYRWIAIPIGFLLGALAILAEPALHVLKKQVEDITGGVIKQKVIVSVVSLGVACSVMTAVLMGLYGFSLLYVIVPVYVICIGLSFFNSKLFTAVAFDSGGVATGAMAVSFILPMVTGLSEGSASGFGTIALIAAFPILTMQVLGCIYRIVLLKNKATQVTHKSVQIVEFNWEQVFEENSVVDINKAEKAIKKITKKSKNQKTKNKKSNAKVNSKSSSTKKRTTSKTNSNNQNLEISNKELDAEQNLQIKNEEELQETKTNLSELTNENNAFKNELQENFNSKETIENDSEASTSTDVISDSKTSTQNQGGEN